MAKFFFLITFLIMSQAFSSNFGIIEEELYVYDQDGSILKLVESRPELIVDHKTSMGFELYGPVGTKKWLESLKIAHDLLVLSEDKGGVDYPSFEENEKKLKELAKSYSHIAKLFSIGKSVEGRDLYVMKISKEVELDRVLPEFKYISSMHGDEITGRELTILFIEELLSSYGKDSELTNLIDNTEIFIMPSMNPDGSQKKRRSNANYVDLNRNFPDWFRRDPNTIDKREPETIAVMNFQKERHFSLSANFHGGTLVANYPWDNAYERHPLDSLLIEMALAYSSRNIPMKENREFKDGITNGSDWYKVAGGMQDWSSIFYNDLQLTLEVSHIKYPSFSLIPDFYKDNRDSMVKFLEYVHQGAGFKTKKRIESGRVEVIDALSQKSLGSFGFHEGEFYKVLPEGEYDYKIFFDSGKKETLRVKVYKDFITPGGNYLEI